jgi:hypothetical protein
MTHLQTFEQMLGYIQKNDLTIDQVNRITSATIGCYLPPLPKQELIKEIEKYYQEWKDTPPQDRPLFTS